MKTIPIETVEEIWGRIAQASESESQALAQRMQKEQPVIMIYLLAMDEGLFEETERGRLIELGAILWQAMAAAERGKRMITETEVEQAEEANLKWLEELDAGRETDFLAGVRGLLQGYNQMPLLGALLEALMQGHEEAPELAPENIGMALVYLKTVIDCLDKP